MKTKAPRVVSSGDLLGSKPLVGYIVMLGVAMSLISLTVDPYLPAFPEIGMFFGVTNGVVQASFAGVTLGIASGQLIIGPLSDAYGRKPLLLFTLSGYLVSTLVAFISMNIETFIVARFFMGFFAAGGDVVGRAIIRDLYRGRLMQKLLAQVYLIQAISPIVGPMLGAQITEFAGWKVVFLAVGVLVLLLLLAAAWFLFESLPVEERRSSSPEDMARGFRKVLRDRTYFGLLIYGAVQLGALYGYLNFAPFIFRNSYALPASEIGLWLAVIGVAGYVGVQVGSFLAKYIKGQWLLLLTAGLGSMSGLALILNEGGSFWITQLAFSLQMFVYGVGLTNVSTIALYAHGGEAGTATSLMGVANFAFTTLLSAFFFLIDSNGSAGVGFIICVLFGFSFFAALLISRPWLIPDLRESKSSEKFDY